MKTKRYGYDGYDFTGGVDIVDLQVEIWIQQILREFEEHPDREDFSISSGNTLVVAHVVESCDGKELLFSVCKGHFDFRIPLKTGESK